MRKNNPRHLIAIDARGDYEYWQFLIVRRGNKQAYLPRRGETNFSPMQGPIVIPDFSITSIVRVVNKSKPKKEPNQGGGEIDLSRKIRGGCPPLEPLS